MSDRIVMRTGESLVAGGHHVSWNGRSDSGSNVVSGVYFVHLKGAGLVTETQKITSTSGGTTAAEAVDPSMIRPRPQCRPV